MNMCDGIENYPQHFTKEGMTKQILYRTDTFVVEVEDLITIEENDGYISSNDNPFEKTFGQNQQLFKPVPEIIDIDDDIAIEDQSFTFSSYPNSSGSSSDQPFPVTLEFRRNDEDSCYDDTSLCDKELEDDYEVLEPETLIVEFDKPFTFENDNVKPGRKKFRDSTADDDDDDTRPNRTDAAIDLGHSKVLCLQCGKTFENNWKLRNHSRVHAKPHWCSICKKRFNELSFLKKHLRNEHAEERPFNCQLCLSSFSSKSALTIHFRSLHLQEKPHKCSLCGKGFAAKQKLRWHAMMHTGKKPFECPVCLVSFYRNDHLTRHLTKHKH